MAYPRRAMVWPHIECPMRRHAFMTLVGGAAAASPLATKAQQSNRVWRIAVLWPDNEADPYSQSRMEALHKALRDLNWADGKNLRLNFRFGATADDRDRIRRYAME